MYKLEVWGAQGGGSNSGKGGYSVGYINMTSNLTLYVAVGGRNGSSTQGDFYTTIDGGYNGGGKGQSGTYYGWNPPTSWNCSTGGGATHIAITNRGVLANYSSNQDEVLIVAGGGGGGSSEASGEGGNGSGGASFGIGCTSLNLWSSSAGGGGGWSGGSCKSNNTGNGGSGYIGGVPTIVYDGTTYSSSMTSGVNSGNGKATITLVSIK